MKLPNKIKILLLIASVTFACSSNKERAETTDSNESSSDTVQAAENVMAPTDQAAFAGEYIIGDGSMYIVPVGDTFEIQDGTGTASDVFTFQGKENDTLNVYSNKDKSVTFKMNLDNTKGRYYADGEELPVELVGPLEQ